MIQHKNFGSVVALVQIHKPKVMYGRRVLHLDTTEYQHLSERRRVRVMTKARNEFASYQRSTRSRSSCSAVVQTDHLEGRIERWYRGVNYDGQKEC
ncbi:hypothetical protein Bhyg_12563 [Pseudolycoriella hygida]|uniref:Uncharacterized protein n=1 Tax=Pseudolycoriella hygida TaxID=35572 RepID=A0A9Q0MXI7_9DIPT|nr:hypothetical protein Bhyg_12563 [Pseudolycoriella hygida]